MSRIANVSYGIKFNHLSPDDTTTTELKVLHFFDKKSFGNVEQDFFAVHGNDFVKIEILSISYLSGE